MIQRPENARLRAPSTRRPTVWLLKEYEPLPTDGKAQLLRTGKLAEWLVEAGCDVRWFVGRFDHTTHRNRPLGPGRLPLGEHYELELLDGRGYARNVSVDRVLHQHQQARHFRRVASRLPDPDIIVAAYPTPELCVEAVRCGKRRGVPVIVDVRDPWPDSFSGGLGEVRRRLAEPIFLYYRQRLRSCLRDARSVVSMTETILDWALGYAGRERRESDRVFYLGYDPAGATTTPVATRASETFRRERPLRCVFFGVFAGSRNGEVVLRAARRLAAGGDDRIEFVFMGDGELLEPWKRQAAGLENVRFTGWVDESGARRELERSHVGLIFIRGGLNPFWCGGKLFAYLYHGLAVVNDTRGEARQILRSRACGVQIDEDDDAALAVALRSLASEPRRLRDLMQGSRTAYEALCSPAATYGRYTEFITSLLRR